jgi:hypothetical protein
MENRIPEYLVKLMHDGCEVEWLGLTLVKRGGVGRNRQVVKRGPGIDQFYFGIVRIVSKREPRNKWLVWKGTSHAIH